MPSEKPFPFQTAFCRLRAQSAYTAALIRHTAPKIPIRLPHNKNNVQFIRQQPDSPYYAAEKMPSETHSDGIHLKKTTDSTPINPLPKPLSSLGFRRRV
ncbi:TPA: hypothetical protein ACLAQM_001672 [Neisseria meningitidis]|uniref:hypothetical protein n=1 Tax=Neisseria meningitidis TaxID=487 RepID=UPI0015D55ABE|nr:hypothetical protein [Neisseria meningitidis]MBG9110343.1 hypothetical protein [Neisseria meningitidis]